MGKGDYYLFRPGTYDNNCVVVDLAISMPKKVKLREDERFRRVLSACFLTGHQKLLEFIYRRLYTIIERHAEKARVPGFLTTFKEQFKAEFPSFNVPMDAPSVLSYNFIKEWRDIRFIVHDFVLSKPILRAWITSDEEDEVPADPRERHIGNHWNMVIGGPTFVKGLVEEWGRGWLGVENKIWQKELDRKYFHRVHKVLADLELEVEA
jgi:hypothetical protein